jgi:hypothetical protein
MPYVVSTISGLIGLVVTIAGVAISAMHVGKVKGAGLMLAGFCLEAFAALIFRLTSFIGMSSGNAAGFVPALAVGSLVSVAGGAVVVAGVYSVLTNAARART